MSNLDSDPGDKAYNAWNFWRIKQKNLYQMSYTIMAYHCVLISWNDLFYMATFNIIARFHFFYHDTQKVKVTSF